MNWTNAKLEKVAGIQELLQSSFCDMRTLLSFSAKILLSFLITSLPGAGSSSPHHA